MCQDVTTTEDLANELKTVLAKEKIKYEIFSKSILNCSKSTLARLLYEPKSWATINEMWKLHFKVIYLWLNDKKRLDKLNYGKSLPSELQNDDDDDDEQDAENEDEQATAQVEIETFRKGKN
jgi:hypothetical protein